VSDQSVYAALRSDSPLVVIEAPAGCGKTHQGADYARERAKDSGTGRVLILTHTHAACSVFSQRTKSTSARSEVRTIDSLIGQVASTYHRGLGLPEDVASWVRRTEDGHALLAVKVAALVKRHPMVAQAISRRYPVVICDEHQDSSGDQYSIISSLLNHGARVRLFADPMQAIFPEQAVAGATPPCDWANLLSQADKCDLLDHPHRWSDGCQELGQWTLKAREALKAGGKVDLRQPRPQSIEVVFAENQAQRNLEYSLSTIDRRRVDGFEGRQTSLLILTRYNPTARSIRSFFNRRIALWEGQTRPSLEELVDAVKHASGDSIAVASAIVNFMGKVGKGFSPSAFGNRLIQELRDGCNATRTGKPAAIQELARVIFQAPDHRGASRMLRRLSELSSEHTGFSDIAIDCHREFWDAARLGDYETPDAALVALASRRIYSRPKPPARAISTIHKAKGLECESVIVMPCDSKTFPDRLDARCLLYVALSRAKSRLMIVASQRTPSPLLIL
jgi:hypothetical protein